MKGNFPILVFVSSFFCCMKVSAEEQKPEIEKLEQVAAYFVTSYNSQNSASLAELFSENGEIADLFGDRIASGRGEIQAHYGEIFAQSDLSLAIEVDSVRFVTPTVAIEDGIYYLSPSDDETTPPKSSRYTAVLVKSEGDVWQIASTRTLADVTEAAGHLASLADLLNGEWTYQSDDGLRLDFAFGWDSTGNYLTSEMLTTVADAEPQTSTVRIGYDASQKQIVSWIFGAAGSFSRGVWTATESGWLIKVEGTTADGEILTSTENLSAELPDRLIWTSKDRVVGGEKAPDHTMQLVRQAPEPLKE